MYRLKGNEGEQTLKADVKLTHLKKIHLKTHQIVSLQRYFEKSHASNLLDFSLPLLFECHRNHHSTKEIKIKFNKHFIINNARLTFLGNHIQEPYMVPYRPLKKFVYDLAMIDKNSIYDSYITSKMSSFVFIVPGAPSNNPHDIQTFQHIITFCGTMVSYKVLIWFLYGCFMVLTRPNTFHFRIKPPVGNFS